MTRTAASLVMALALLGAGIADAAIYRWVDNQGNVHYTQTPPPPGNKDRGTRIRTTGPATGAQEQGQQRADSIQNRLKNFRETRQKAQEEEAEQAAEAERMSKNCTAARDNLSKLENRNLRRIVDAEGKVSVMSEEQRQKKMVEARRQIEENCK